MSIKKQLKIWRKLLKNKLLSKLKADLKHNQINLPDNCLYKITVKGKNNIINLPKGLPPSSVIRINIHGDNNVIDIQTTSHLKTHIKIGDSGTPSHNCRMTLAPETTLMGTEILMLDNNSSLSIGRDTMISWETVIWCTDMHSVLNAEKQATNRGKSISIGNHVWIGRNVYIAKNTVIPDNSIVGWCSNVTSQFSETNTIIAGNPARVVKKNVDWAHERVDDFLQLSAR